MLGRSLVFAALAYGFGITAAVAQSVAITSEFETVSTTVNGVPLVIRRDAEGQPPCPGSCLQPMQAAAGVATAGELEVLGFLTGPAANGTGLLIDTRLPEDYATRALPGSVNVPGATLNADNPFRAEILKALGARQSGSSGQWDFGGALRLMLYSDGPTSASAPDAVRDLVSAGYPPAKLGYYRGGLAAWQGAGLTMR